MKVVELDAEKRSPNSWGADGHVSHSRDNSELSRSPKRNLVGLPATLKSLPVSAPSIPSISLAQLGDFFSGRYLRLTDILRHEWAHALADVHPDFVECPTFVRYFGGEYEDPEAPEDYDRELHVSKYAATMPAEDFAETFHFYIRHKGRLPVRLAGRPAIVRKWNFIERIARAMGSGRTGFR